MSGSPGNNDGMVYLAHAWCPADFKAVTVGPWHWWNVYKDEDAAAAQALRRSKGWGTHGRYEVLTVTPNAYTGEANEASITHMTAYPKGAA